MNDFTNQIKTIWIHSNQYVDADVGMVWHGSKRVNKLQQCNSTRTVDSGIGRDDAPNDVVSATI